MNVDELVFVGNRRAVTLRRTGDWDIRIPKHLADAYLEDGCQLEWRPVNPSELRVIVIPPGVGPRRTRRKLEHVD